jgi:hypothetical protein
MLEVRQKLKSETRDRYMLGVNIKVQGDQRQINAGSKREN